MARAGRDVERVRFANPVILADARGLTGKDGEPRREQDRHEHGGGAKARGLARPDSGCAPAPGERDAGKDHLGGHRERAVVVRVAEAGRGDGVGRPPGERAPLAPQRAQHRPGREPGERGPHAVHPDVAAVAHLVGVDGDEKRGGDGSPSPDRGTASASRFLSVRVPFDLDVEQVGEQDGRHPQEHREATQRHRRIAARGHPELEHEVVEGRVHVGRGARHDVGRRMGRHSPREGLVGGQLLEAEAVHAERRSQEKGEYEPEDGTIGGAHGVHGCAGL